MKDDKIGSSRHRRGELSLILKDNYNILDTSNLRDGKKRIR